MRRRRRPNDWKPIDPRTRLDHGKAIITVSRDVTLPPVRTGGPPRPFRFPRRLLVRLVERWTAGASIVWQLGATRAWGRETSTQVVLLNGELPWARPVSWSVFVHQAKTLAEELAKGLMQEAVTLELHDARGGYSIQAFVNDYFEPGYPKPVEGTAKIPHYLVQRHRLARRVRR